MSATPPPSTPGAPGSKAKQLQRQQRSQAKKDDKKKKLASTGGQRTAAQSLGESASTRGAATGSGTGSEEPDRDRGDEPKTTAESDSDHEDSEEEGDDGHADDAAERDAAEAEDRREKAASEKRDQAAVGLLRELGKQLADQQKAFDEERKADEARRQEREREHEARMAATAKQIEAITRAAGGSAKATASAPRTSSFPAGSAIGAASRPKPVMLTPSHATSSAFTPGSVRSQQLQARRDALPNRAAEEAMSAARKAPTADYSGAKQTTLTMDAIQKEPAKVREWIRSLERAFAMMGIAPEDNVRRVGVGEVWMDFPLSEWWRMATNKIDPSKVATWEFLREELLGMFRQDRDDQIATDEFMKMRQGKSQGMLAYACAADQLVYRGGDYMAAELGEGIRAKKLLDGVDESRYADLKRGAALQFNDRRLQTFEEMKDFLINAANAEDEVPRASQQRQPEAPRQRVNATAVDEEAAPAALDIAAIVEAAMRKLQTAAIGAGPPRDDFACRKCGQKGHIARNCRSSKDIRECYNCHEKGHLSSACTKERRPRKEPAPASAAPPGGTAAAAKAKN